MKKRYLNITLAILILAGCAGPAQSTVKPETSPVITQEVPASAAVPGPNESAPGLQASEDPYWEVDNIEAFDELMSNADGYAYYYIFEKVLKDLKVVRVGMPTEMDHYNITFQNSENEYVELFVFTIPEGFKDDNNNFNKMELDGTTYYWSEEYHEGELLVSYFQWKQDNKIILVHPKEPITEDVIRKYNKIIKKEFNKGKEQVGLDTDKALIKDIEKIKNLVKGNQKIHYHTGVVSAEYGDDLLR